MAASAAAAAGDGSAAETGAKERSRNAGTPGMFTGTSSELGRVVACFEGLAKRVAAMRVARENAEKKEMQRKLSEVRFGFDSFHFCTLHCFSVSRSGLNAS